MTASPELPLVSIGLPVYNGESVVGEAIASLLQQSYPRIELIISDNGSTDRTFEILQEWSQRDSRVRISRNEINQGAPANFRKVADLAQGDYFMWAAHDDLWAPTFIQENLDNLQRNPGAVCSIPQVESLKDGRPDGIGTDTFPLLADPGTNVDRFLRDPGLNSRMYGLFPAHVAKEAAQVGPYWTFDQLITVRTLKYGTHLELPKVLMWRRRGGESSNMPRAVRNYEPYSWVAQIFPRWHFTVALLREPHVKKNVALLWFLLIANVSDTLFVAFYALHNSVPFLRPVLGALYHRLRGRPLAMNF